MNFILIQTDLDHVYYYTPVSNLRFELNCLPITASNIIHYVFAIKKINPLGIFDEHFLFERLTKLKDPLVKLEAHIEWKIFPPILDVVFNKPQNISNAGRPPI
jgi:hypothetical protein